ncbi:MAG: DUF6364 family protein [Ferruginibacter sp.]|nr:DUF6364 family protein [Ferruginibacter sp.]
MTTKLTLTLDNTVINSAKKYAKSTGRSLSSVVENYLKNLDLPLNAENEFSPKIRKMMGVIKIADDYDYKKDLTNTLAKKYL